MTKVAIHGSYFANNFGDTLLVRLMCDKVSEIVGSENVFLARDPHAEERKYLPFPVVKVGDEPKIDKIIYCGGGYFGEPSGGMFTHYKWALRNYLRHLAWVNSYKNAQISIIGAGLGPISVPLFRWQLKQLLNRCKIVALRDRESIDFLQNYGFDTGQVLQVVDYALSLYKKKLSVGENGVVAIHLGELNEDELQIVLSVLRRIECNEVECIFDSSTTSVEDIRARYKRAFEACGSGFKYSIKEYQGSDELIDRLRMYRFIVTSKLHVGIVSIALGKKVISIPAHQKTIRLYRQLGLSDFCIQRSSLSADLLYSAVNKLDEFSPDMKVIEDGVGKLDASIVHALSD